MNIDQKSPAMTTEQAQAIVSGFIGLVRSRSAVRLDFRNYWSVDRASSMEAYLQDRNTIRRQTLAFDTAWRQISWRNPISLACALIVTSRTEFSGRIKFNEVKQTWSYCAGQYMPTEIRLAGERVVNRAAKIID